MKLFQNQKLDSELNNFQSILIVSSHPDDDYAGGGCMSHVTHW